MWPFTAAAGLSIKAIIIIVALGAVVSAFYMWRADIKKAVYKEIYADFFEQKMKEQAKEIEKIKTIIVIQDKTIAELRKKNEVVVQKSTTVRDKVLADPQTNKPASPALNSAVEELKKAAGINDR